MDIMKDCRDPLKWFDRAAQLYMSIKSANMSKTVMYRMDLVGSIQVAFDNTRINQFDRSMASHTLNTCIELCN